MGLETMKQYTEDVKRQAQELIEQTYQRGFKEGYGDSESQKESLIEQAYRRGWKVGKSDGYNEGFKAGQENALAVDSDKYREQGRNEAWEAAHKLVGMSCKECNKILSDGDLTIETNDDIFAKYTASKVIENLRKFAEVLKKETNEIKVGDEVVSNNGDKGIVLCYYHETDSCGNFKEEWLVVYMSDYDVPQTVTKKRFKKTGKHYDVMSILKKMKEGENDQ